ncbi:MAG: hypothetical protein QF797_00675, partial [Alphaproteobacteria bacterium]|nr:hypothetical protein [Alphaproteobacteria bacterium]
MPINGLGDEVLASLDRARASQLVNLPGQRKTRLREVEVSGIDHFVLERELAGYGEVPLIIGFHMPVAQVDAPLRLLYSSGLVG